MYIGLDNDGYLTGIVDLDTTQLKIADRIKNNILPSTLGLFDIVTEAVENMTVIILKQKECHQVDAIQELELQVSQ